MSITENENIKKINTPSLLFGQCNRKQRSFFTPNVGIAVENWNRGTITCRSKVISTSGFCYPPSWISLVCHRLPTSVNLRQYPQCQVEVGRGRKCRGSLWNRVAIYCTVQKLFPVPVWWPPSWIRSQQCRATSTSSFPGPPWSKMLC